MGISDEQWEAIPPAQSLAPAGVELRPCFVKERKANFHCWGTFADEDGSGVCGVIEYEDGTCDWFPPNMIKFADKAT